MADIKVRLQGPASILRGDEARPIPASTQPLFVALALAGPRGASRDQLLDRLWPDQPPSKARRRLNTTVWRLREAFAEAQPESDSGGVVSLTSGWLCVDWDRVELDAAPLFQLIASHPSRLESLSVHRLEASASVDVNRLALGCHHPFVDRARHQWGAARTEACAQLASRAFVSGDWMVSVHWSQDALRSDPYREDLHQLVMRSLHLAGRPRDAEAQYAECVRLLQDDLGIDPLPETVAAAHRDPGLITSPHLHTGHIDSGRIDSGHIDSGHIDSGPSDTGGDLVALRDALERAVRTCERAASAGRTALEELAGMAHRRPQLADSRPAERSGDDTVIDLRTAAGTHAARTVRDHHVIAGDRTAIDEG